MCENETVGSANSSVWSGVPTSAEVAARALENEQVLNNLLHTALNRAPLIDVLLACLDILLSISWLSILPKGGIFLTESAARVLKLVAQRNLSPELLTLCAQVPFGHCLCGRAASTRSLVHASCIDHRHENTFEGIKPHGHYNIPLLDNDQLLGVLVVYLPHGHAGDDLEKQFLKAVADILALVIRQKRIELDLEHEVRTTRQQLDELSRLTERFEAAVNNMPQGVCLFDANQRIVLANSLYGELYHLTGEQIAPGTALQEILEYRSQNGTSSSTAPETYLSVNVRNHKETQELADGRTISISRRFLSDGGWLTTHEDITERRASEKKIAYLAEHDQLTGLPNRASFVNALERIASESRADRETAVLLLDLDRFKAVNDTLGHAAGDQLLREVARRLQSATRQQDFVARLGGDEFAIIQRLEAGGHEAAVSLALRIIDVIGKPFELEEQIASVGTSIGIALCSAQPEDCSGLLKKADLALYAVKDKGRNNFQIYDSAMSELLQNQNSLKSELRAAIEQGQFELYYQPILDLKAREIRCAEALIRWHHPRHGLIFPDKFISLAEETGLIVQLGEWVLQQGCKDAAAWPGNCRVAINLSAHQFKPGNLFDLVLCALVESGLSPDRLELEITETALLHDQFEHLLTLRQIHNIGVTVALDDFGTGYSSANYLTLFPFDKIKIDKSFVQGMGGRRDCAAVVDSTLALARGLDIEVTAEGVETQEQLERLSQSGVDFVQGYLIGRPMTLEQFLSDDRELSHRTVA